MASTMGLKLRYLDSSQLWADLGEADRLFVPGAEGAVVGAELTVELEVVGLGTPLWVTAHVEQVRPARGEFPAGALVRVEPVSLERCREALRPPRGPEATDGPGAREVQVACNLAAKIITPKLVDSCIVKSLAPGGFSLNGAGILLEGTRATVSIGLPDGSRTELTAEVLWVRPELDLAGFRILGASEGVTAKLAGAVAQLKSDSEPAAPTGVTIVVADDDPSILDFSFRALSKPGHRVLRAERGDDALALIREQRPRLVFLDVLMPGLDGLEVCRAMRAEPALARIPVVLLSAMGEARLAEAATQVGASDYLTKPMRLEAIRALVKKHLG